MEVFAVGQCMELWIAIELAYAYNIVHDNTLIM